MNDEGKGETAKPFSSDFFSLPQRHVDSDLGKAQERAMAHVAGGLGGIRTVEFMGPNGTVARLRTRGGYPVFEEYEDDTAAKQNIRGFVAMIPSGRAVLFDPYTLSVMDGNYFLGGKIYSVQDFYTPYGLSTEGKTWNDVICAYREVLINAKPMNALGVFSPLSISAIPHVINRNDAYDQYGNVEANLTVKRYFEIERDSVKSFANGGVVEQITPREPITDTPKRAIVSGPWVSLLEDQAMLGMLYHTTNDWASVSASWSFISTQVQMLLTASYLSKTQSTLSVDMPVVALGAAVPSSGTIEEAITLPSTEIAAYGLGEAYSATEYTYDPAGSSGHYEVVYPWRGTVSSPLPGKYTASYSRNTYSGSGSATQHHGGVELVYSGSNEKKRDTRSEGYSEDAAIINYTGESVGFGGLTAALDADATTLFWTPASWEPGALPNVVGKTSYTNIGHGIGHGAGRYYEMQEGNFSVKANGTDLVSVVFSRNKSYGSKEIISPHLGYYDNLLAAPYSNLHTSFGMGIMCGPIVLSYKWYPGGSDIVPIRNYYKVVDGVQDPAAVGEINAKYRELQDALASKTMYDDEVSMAVYRVHYDATLDTDYTEDDKSLEWTTRDYLLHDEDNGVYVYVEGEYEGTQGVSGSATATLTVRLTIDTRYGAYHQDLETFELTYSDLLPERSISGISAIPSPQIRAIFTPLHREQGSFRGAHYVTLAEEGRGAGPFHGFNFVLRLRTYDGIGTTETNTSSGPEVIFIPCNLLEMLYAFVFSQSYGVPLDGSRYQVTRSATHTEVMTTLFTNAYRISVKDGVSSNWTDAFGSDFASVTNATLHRT